MVIGNYMNLSGIEPKEGLKWFIEFALDSYEWVMYQNVYDMVFFTTGGLTMRRPYASSSNYIIKMSNYPTKSKNSKNSKNEDSNLESRSNSKQKSTKDVEHWTIKWDKAYHDFIKNNEKKLYKFRYYFPALRKKEQ